MLCSCSLFDAYNDNMIVKVKIYNMLEPSKTIYDTIFKLVSFTQGSQKYPDIPEPKDIVDDFVDFKDRS